MCFFFEGGSSKQWNVVLNTEQNTNMTYYYKFNVGPHICQSVFVLKSRLLPAWIDSRKHTLNKYDVLLQI